MTETGAIDEAEIAELLESTGGDPEFLADLIDAYVEDTAALFASMRQAAASGEAQALRRAAHSVKSTSASFGARRLAALSQDLEARAHAGSVDGAAERIAEAEAEYESVKTALLAIRDRR